MRALGAKIVPVSYDRAWVAAESHEFPGIDATFVHPFDNHDFIAGHGTMGLEIVEDCPDVRTVICAIGGGGLITGVGSALKAKAPRAKVLGAEPVCWDLDAYRKQGFIDGVSGNQLRMHYTGKGGKILKAVPLEHARWFAGLIGQLSEPNGEFVSRSGSPDNLLSNEMQVSTVGAALAGRVKPSGVYLGVGPEQNFTYIAAVRPAMAFIVDVRRGNLDLHLMYKALFELSADRIEFVSRLFSMASIRSVMAAMWPPS